MVDKSNSRMSPELQLVSNYVLQEERKMKGVTHSITPPQKRTKTNVTITPPSNGVQYRKSEVVNELQKYKKGSKDRGCTGEISKKKMCLKSFFSQCNVVDIVCLMNTHQDSL